MPLVGIFDGIGNEVGQQLLQSSTVENSLVSGVGIICKERNTRFLYALFE